MKTFWRVGALSVLVGCTAESTERATVPVDADRAVDASRSVDLSRGEPDAPEPPDATPMPIDATPVADAAPPPVDQGRAPDVPAVDDARPSGDGPATPPSVPAPVECARPWGRPQDAGALGDPDLREASGLVGSRRDSRILWSHNDSGDSSRLFALRTDGARIARYFLLDVMARDFEDAAAAPCPHQPGACLWIADVGNNRLDRPEVVVYVVPEPELDPEREYPPQTSGRVLRLPVRWPGAPRNCEALVVASDGSTFYLIEKAEGETASVHRHPGPLADGVSVELARVADLRVPGPVVAGARLVTGASLHPLGRRLAVRTYGGVFEYFLDPEGGLDRLDLALAVSLTPAEAEFQGEAIGYGPNGDTLFTVSEDARAQGDRMLHRYACTADD